MYSVIVAAALAAQGPAAPAGQWEQVSTADGFTSFVDAAGIRREGGKVRFRIRGVRAAPAEDGAISAILAVEFDCATGTASLYSRHSYGAGGNEIEALETQEGERRTGPLGRGNPNDEAIFQRVCGHAIPPAPAAAQ